MNLFLLHVCLKKCAQQHADKHVVKMILELAQLLSTAYWILNPEQASRLCVLKKTHVNHPVAVWTREHANNYDLVASLACELLKEYTYRYGKHHKLEPLIHKMQKYPPKNLDYKEREDLGGHWNTTPPKQCFGEGNDHLKRKDPIKGYRNYYNTCKRHLHSWKKRPVPGWITPPLRQRHPRPRT